MGVRIFKSLSSVINCHKLSIIYSIYANIHREFCFLWRDKVV